MDLKSIVSNYLNTNYQRTKLLAKMQIHYMSYLGNKDRLKGTWGQVIKDIMQKYEKEVKTDTYGYVKIKDKFYLVKNGHDYGNGAFNFSNLIKQNRLFPGIYPPVDGFSPIQTYIAKPPKKWSLFFVSKVASEAENIKKFKTVDTFVLKFNEQWTYWLSSLEYWVLQIEAIEQDMMAYK